jgi:beta-glucanase (GH16 family)
MSPHGPRSWVVLLVISTVVLAFGLQIGAAPKRPSKPPPEQDSFVDGLGFYDTTRWTKADGWTNGSPFDNAWSANNVLFEDGNMILRLEETPLLGKDYTSGEYRTIGFYGYGCYEASFKPVPESGVVTSFFTYAGPWDNGGNGKHNEIDIEFLGYDTNKVQFNFYTNDDNYTSRNERVHGTWVSMLLLVSTGTRSSGPPQGSSGTSMATRSTRLSTRLENPRPRPRTRFRKS